MMEAIFRLYKPPGDKRALYKDKQKCSNFIIRILAFSFLNTLWPNFW